MPRHIATIVLFIALVNQAMWNSPSSAGVLFHGHGGLGIHAHVVSLADNPESAGQSALWGHRGGPMVGVEPLGDVVVVLFLPTIQVLPVDDRASVRAELTAGGAAGADFAPGETASVRLAKIDIHHPFDGHSPHRSGLSGLVQTSRALLI